MEEEFATTSEVCKLLKVDAMRPTRWEQQGILKRVQRGRYLTTDLDAFLEIHAHNFTAALTWERLRKGIENLVTQQEAITEFGVDKLRLFSLKRSGHLAYVKLPGQQGSVRFSHNSLGSTLAPLPVLGGEQVARILGTATTQPVKRLIAQGMLVRIDNPRDRNRIYIAPESLTNYLQEYRLPPWVNAALWVLMRINDPEALVGSREAAVRLDVGRERLPQLLRKEQAWFISVSGTNIQVLNSWLEIYLEKRARACR